MLIVRMKSLPTVITAVHQVTGVCSKMMLVTGVGDEMSVTRSARHPFFKPAFCCIRTAPATVWTNVSSSVTVTNFAAFAKVGSLQEGGHRSDDRKMSVSVVEIDLFFSKLGAAVHVGVAIVLGIDEQMIIYA